MATVYKRTRLKSIPVGAEVIIRGGKRWARWTDAKTGLRKRAPLNAAGDRIIMKLGNYCISYFDHNGRRVVESARTCDRDMAELLAAKRQTEVMQRSKGLIDVTAERYAQADRRGLSQHITDFENALSAKSNTPKHVDETADKVRAVVKS